MRYLPHQVRRFVLLFEGRTGSTFLITALNQHSKILAMREILDPVEEKGATAQRTVTRKALTPRLLSRYKALGFKTKLRVLQDPDDFAALLQELSVSIIFMQRRNLVKSVISGINAMRHNEAVGLFNLYDKDDRLPPPVIELEKFQKWLTYRQELNKDLADYIGQLQLPVLEIFYEDLLVDNEQVFRRVFSFLDVPYEEVEGRSIKITSDDLREAVVNFDELRSHYEGTIYEAMFDEVLVPGQAEASD